MAFDIDKALTYMVEREGSDLHLKADSPPVARVHGDLWALQGADELSADDTEAVLEHVMDDARLREEFAEVGEADFSYAVEGVSRFRVNAFRQRGSVSIAFRAIPF